MLIIQHSYWKMFLQYTNIANIMYSVTLTQKMAVVIMDLKEAIATAWNAIEITMNANGDYENSCCS